MIRASRKLTAFALAVLTMTPTAFNMHAARAEPVPPHVLDPMDVEFDNWSCRTGHYDDWFTPARISGEDCDVFHKGTKSFAVIVYLESVVKPNVIYPVVCDGDTFRATRVYSVNDQRMETLINCLQRF
ncbi:hypothetical protein [Actinomadura oligospora]|uniref:hypothetical protein n=1 Tax=Actinomadura oligospora TaxID=111804 RepID=UPI0012F9D287|nr:hypothetical protein [Actinomadura oligospora]